MRVKALAAVLSLALAAAPFYPASAVYADTAAVTEVAAGEEHGTTEEAAPDPGKEGEDTPVLPGEDVPDTEEVDPAGNEVQAPSEADASEGQDVSEGTDASEGPETADEQKEEPSEKEEAAEPEENAVPDETEAPVLDPEEEGGALEESLVNPVRTEIDGKYYIVYENGTHHTGWFVYDSGNKCYCDPENDGALLTGIGKIETKAYYFNEKGTLVRNKEGRRKIGGKWYYLLKSGRLGIGWKNTTAGRMYFSKTDFAAKTGVKKVNGKRYLFNDKGILFSPGTPLYKGHKYWVKDDRSLGTGWLEIKGTNQKLYFSEKNYRALIGKKKAGKRYYYFNSDGVVLGVGGGTPVINGKKYWTRKDGSLRSGWMSWSGMKCYFIPKKFYAATGKLTINGKKYRFNEDGVMIPFNTGRQLKNGRMYYYDNNGDLYRNIWVTYNGEKIYVDGNGVGLADLSDKIGGPYTLYVDRSNCVVTAYSGSTPVRSMLCSVGTPGNETPVGTWNIFAKYTLKELMGPSWGQYASKVHYDGIYFHSVATESALDPWHAVPVGEYNKLGQPASHGCIRLCVRDAKWIYDHCAMGTTVVIGDWFDMPFGKPFLTKISTPVDPTDPAV